MVFGEKLSAAVRPEAQGVIINIRDRLWGNYFAWNISHACYSRVLVDETSWTLYSSDISRPPASRSQFYSQIWSIFFLCTLLKGLTMYSRGRPWGCQFVAKLIVECTALFLLWITLNFSRYFDSDLQATWMLDSNAKQEHALRERKPRAVTLTRIATKI